MNLRDPTTADVLVETLADPRATATWRVAARRALERLTYVSYYLSEPHNNQYAETVPRTGATSPENPFKTSADADAVAAFYRERLGGDGKDPARWLDLARARARVILAGDDLDSIYCIVSFLAPRHWDKRVDGRRDDQPDRTVARVGQILAQCKYAPVRREGERTQHSYTCNGRPLPVSVFNWTGLLAQYGWRARPHVATIVRIQEECGLPVYSGLANLLYIGGAEAVEYFAVCLPRVDRALAERDLVAVSRDASLKHEGLPEHQTAREWVIAARIVTYGFDRWVGRTFQDTESRLAWWAEHKGRPPEQWLRGNLTALAEQADTGDAVARSIVLQVLPEAPRAAYEFHDHPTGFSSGRHGATTTAAATTPVPSVAGWLRENGTKLQYDPQQHALRVTSATQPINPR